MTPRSLTPKAQPPNKGQKTRSQSVLCLEVRLYKLSHAGRLYQAVYVSTTPSPPTPSPPTCPLLPMIYYPKFPSYHSPQLHSHSPDSDNYPAQPHLCIIPTRTHHPPSNPCVKGNPPPHSPPDSTPLVPSAPFLEGAPPF